MKKIHIKDILQIIFFLPIIIPAFIIGWILYYFGEKKHERIAVQN